MIEMPGVPLLDLSGVTKSFGAIKALRGAEFTLLAGEIHALVGENGAGKSTLMNIIDGILQPDSGAIRIDGEAVRIDSPATAQATELASMARRPRRSACLITGTTRPCSAAVAIPM